MPRSWVSGTGEVIWLPVGRTHEDVAEDFGLTQAIALSEGWVRVTGGVKSLWEFEVYDIRRGDTIALIEGFIFGEGTGAKRIVIETIKPKRTYFYVTYEDVEASGFRDAVMGKFQRALLHPTLGNPKKLRRTH